MKTIKFFICILLISCSVNFQTPIPVGNQITSFSSMVRGYYFTSPEISLFVVLRFLQMQILEHKLFELFDLIPLLLLIGQVTTNNFTQLFAQTNFTGTIIPCNISVSAEILLEFMVQEEEIVPIVMVHQDM